MGLLRRNHSLIGKRLQEPSYDEPALPAGYSFWLDFHDRSKMTLSGQEVTSIQEKAQGLIFAPPHADREPNLHSSGLSFVAQGFRGPTPYDFNISGVSYTIYCSVDFFSPPTSYRPLYVIANNVSWPASGWEQQLVYFFNSIDSKYYFEFRNHYDFSNALLLKFHETDAPVTKALCKIHFDATANKIFFWVNGIFQTSFDYPYPYVGTDTGRNVSIAMNRHSTYASDQAQADLLVYPKVLTQQEDDLIHQLLSQRIGLDIQSCQPVPNYFDDHSFVQWPNNGFVPGKEAVGANSLYITGNGQYVNNNPNTLTFLYKMIEGHATNPNFEIIADLSLPASGAYSGRHYGLMIMRAIGNGQRRIGMGRLADSPYLQYHWRSADSGSVYVASCPNPSGLFVKLKRKGNNIEGYYSSDGIDWILREDRGLTTYYSDPVYVGVYCLHGSTAANEFATGFIQNFQFNKL